MSAELGLWVLGILGLLAVVVIALVWRRSRRRLPGKISEFRCELEGARVEADDIVRRTWVVPVVFTNSRRVPALAPVMHSLATVRTGRRTRVLRRPYVHNGVFQWDGSVPAGTFNPQATLAGRVTVELPADEIPQRIAIARFVNGKRGPAYTGVVALVDSA